MGRFTDQPKTPSKAMAKHSGGYLSSQLLGEAHIGGSQSMLEGHKERPYLKNNPRPGTSGSCL
jgi:hypothetical protein